MLHSYGLTETYGPALVCTWKREWDGLEAEERARIKARQGVSHVGLQAVEVMDPVTMRAVRRDGKTMGEIMARGSTIMKGYFKDDEATRQAFEVRSLLSCCRKVQFPWTNQVKLTEIHSIQQFDFERYSREEDPLHGTPSNNEED